VPTGSFLPDSNAHEGWCSSDWTLGMVVDKVVIPETTKPGRYVVRYAILTDLILTSSSPNPHLILTSSSPPSPHLTLIILTSSPTYSCHSWRMDCEETAQIWQNCADVNIVA
jgi:hypothetical protein